ncbi:transcriptional regulator [Limnochorda pilosa]|uniref:Transcriptional regulator n=2 Tax=Limnochorda pilosa TaxID=1555112 RepID=A0A0K2SPK7_LIMPI|nr:transcriptional regulator [Limnochorda pilosa]
MGGPGTRRSLIAERLRAAGVPVAGAQLAEGLGVSRQVIVQDVAVLRAAGAPILATPRGYVWVGEPGADPRFACRRVVAVDHAAGQIEVELNAVADLGGRVVDVVVEHPVYGELRGLVMTESRADVQEFLARLHQGGAGPLLTLTGGPHLHTLEAASQERLDRIVARLEALGFLIEERGEGSGPEHP